MRVLVYDVAAEDGGGRFVLKNFYKEVLQTKPDNIEWIFMVSIDGLESVDNVIILKYTKPKKSWLHRLIFENLELQGIVKELNVDLIISLQNMPLKKCKVRQFVYLHQSLQYCEKRFSFLKKEERSLAIRQSIICDYFYKKNLPLADHIFVQTNWIKQATEKWIQYSHDKITVVPVSVPADGIKEYKGEKSRIFFYPARAEIYKNHKVVIEAVQKLINEGYSNLKVIFTIKAEENSYTEKLYKLSGKLPIEYIGEVDYNSIWDYYSKTILIFPSYLETCGLPMVEMKALGGRILASDLPFSHEVLDGYPNAEFFTYDDSEALAEKMKKVLDRKRYSSMKFQNMMEEEKVTDIGLLEAMLKRI